MLNETPTCWLGAIEAYSIYALVGARSAHSPPWRARQSSVQPKPSVPACTMAAVPESGPLAAV